MRNVVTSEISIIGAHHPHVGRRYGSYKVLSVLGEGGMGYVYLAEHTALGRRVAIKRLKEQYANQPDAVNHFFEEARAVNLIRHPHIVEITDFVEEPGNAYCVMELLEGQTLRKTLKIEGVLSNRRAMNICHQVAEALQAAHEKGIAHLDIKPSNIFLTEREGRHDYVKLLDFGVARLIDATPDAAGNAGSTSSTGTPAYMSPEQAVNAPADHRSDIYSLGAVLYEMLSGRPPFVAESTAEFVYKHTSEKPTTLLRLKNLPERISASSSRIAMRCLEKDPKDRYQTAAELAKSLERVARSSGIILRTGSMPAVRLPKPVWRRALPWGLGGLAVLAVGIVALVLALSGKKPEKAAAARVARPAAMKPALSTRDVLLKVSTTPRGASIFRTQPDPRMLGLSPLRIRLPRSSRTWTLLIRRDGYEDRKVEVVLKSDQSFSLELKPVTPRPPPDEPAMEPPRRPKPGTSNRSSRRRRPGKHRRSGDSDIVDPFD